MYIPKWKNYVAKREGYHVSFIHIPHHNQLYSRWPDNILCTKLDMKIVLLASTIISTLQNTDEMQRYTPAYEDIQLSSAAKHVYLNISQCLLLCVTDKDRL